MAVYRGWQRWSYRLQGPALQGNRLCFPLHYIKNKNKNKSKNKSKNAHNARTHKQKSDLNCDLDSDKRNVGDCARRSHNLRSWSNYE